MTETKMTPSNNVIDFGKIYRDLLKHKRLYCIVLPVAFALSALYMLSIPNFYTCTVKLSPELSNRSSTNSSLASLASSFGVNIGSMGNSSEALFPTLYPDLMASPDFMVSLFKVQVKPEGSNQVYNYYDYKKNVETAPWWKKVVRALFSDDSNDSTFNPRKLTKEQNDMIMDIQKNIVCSVDKKTMVITISVTDNDPNVSTTMADSTMALLQRYITDYRTSKARVDLEYNKKILAEAKANYEKASRAYASYADANLHTFQERILQRKSELETEMTLQRSVYQQVVAQYQKAEMELQEETPAFAVIQASTIPAKKAGPMRAKVCLVFLVLAFLATSVYILYKEDDLKSLIGM